MKILILKIQATPAAAQLAHMQALPFADSGTCSITAGVKTASMHQQRSGSVPLALAVSMAQLFGL
jgi:hypothetical protein